MTNRIFSIAGLLIVQTLSNCGSPECLTMPSKENQIVFGNGGGFRGTERSHLLTDQGCIYRRMKAVEDWGLTKSIAKKDAKKLFKEAIKIGLNDTIFHNPGSVYSYIQFVDGASKKKVTWGDPQKEPPAEIAEFYQKLRKLTQD